MANKKIVVCGAGGFIGGHLVARLKSLGHWVRGVDVKHNEYIHILCEADEFIIGDLRKIDVVDSIIDESIDEIYQLAADMGGAEYIFTGDHDADIMHNSALINLNVCETCVKYKIKKIFYSSSACIYPEYNQLDPNNPKCNEDSAYPANPDSDYGWEKLFSERLYFAFAKNYGIEVHVARFHNIFGPYGTWSGGKEKAPAAICRKVALAKDGENIQIFGDGIQTRSFLYIDECIDGILRLMNSNFAGPVNIGSDEMISINQLAAMVIGLSGKNLTIKNISGPTGVRGRNSDNNLILEKLGWAPSLQLKDGITKLYMWISSMIM